MREVVVDTETTGLDPALGDRVVEIGCLELINHVQSGQRFHTYLNPERPMPAAAYEVHGIGDDFLKGQPLFAAVVEDFLAFLGDSPLVIHNAAFDLGFLNAELARLGRPPLALERATDTIGMARRKFPGAQASLDALCRRFAINLSSRKKHGALVDAGLLAEVYLELLGGRQPALGLAAAADMAATLAAPAKADARPLRDHQPTAAELARHSAFLDRLKDPLWRA
jgi:DNA polymerase-3 subunit epsilon